VVTEVLRLDGRPARDTLFLVLLARAADVEAVEEDLLPIDLVLLLDLLLLLPARRTRLGVDSSSSGSTSSRNGLPSNSCFRCCWRSIIGMYSMSIAW
jgi:hypothetical protein